MSGLHAPAKGIGAWTLWGDRRQFFDFSVQDRAASICLSRSQSGSWLAEQDGRMVSFEFAAVSGNSCRVTIEGTAKTFDFAISGNMLTLFEDGSVYVFTRQGEGGPQATARGSGTLSAPIPALVSRIFVRPGAKVRQGQPLLVVEAMKMEHMISAPHDGVVESVLATEGERVAEGAVLVKLKDASHG
jgi:biotin carboxyl carrier protein